MCYNVQTSDIPVGWQPECVLLEGMFLINTKPLGMHKCLADYANFLLARHVATQFSRGAVEVHIIFDNPGRLPAMIQYLIMLSLIFLLLYQSCCQLTGLDWRWEVPYGESHDNRVINDVIATHQLRFH